MANTPGRGAKRSILPILMTLGVVLFTPPPTHGQSFGLNRLSIEPRVGAAFPTGDFGNVDPSCPPGGESCPFPLQVGTETGWRWSVRALVEITPRLSVLGEYGRTSLGCSPAFCGTDKKPQTQAVGVGLRAIVFPLGSMDIWVEGGAVLEEASIIRTRDQSGSQSISTVSYPWSVGFSGGFGAELALTGERTSFFTPGFRFQYVPADPPSTDSDLSSITATYMLFEIGFRILLGK